MVTMIRLVVEIQHGKNKMYEFLEIENFERYLLRSIL